MQRQFPTLGLRDDSGVQNKAHDPGPEDNDRPRRWTRSRTRNRNTNRPGKRGIGGYPYRINMTASNTRARCSNWDSRRCPEKQSRDRNRCYKLAKFHMRPPTNIAGSGQLTPGIYRPQQAAPTSRSTGYSATFSFLNSRHKKKDRLAAASPKSDQMFDQAASAAVLFRFLRQPSRPNAPRPEAKSGRVAGSGVSAILPPVIPMGGPLSAP